MKRRILLTLLTLTLAICIGLSILAILMATVLLAAPQVAATTLLPAFFLLL